MAWNRLLLLGHLYSEYIKNKFVLITFIIKIKISKKYKYMSDKIKHIKERIEDIMKLCHLILQQIESIEKEVILSYSYDFSLSERNEFKHAILDFADQDRIVQDIIEEMPKFKDTINRNSLLSLLCDYNNIYHIYQTLDKDVPKWFKKKYKMKSSKNEF
ncbi:MAG: hypothetical protein QXO70_03225 [Candidatus Pacearchaeota archaeon]